MDLKQKNETTTTSIDLAIAGPQRNKPSTVLTLLSNRPG
jgi:hypothetical protein